MFISFSQCGVQQRRTDLGVGCLGDEAVHADQGGGQAADAEEGHASGEVEEEGFWCSSNMTLSSNHRWRVGARKISNFIFEADGTVTNNKNNVKIDLSFF